LQSGNLLLVNNDSDTKRAKMTAWLSKDDGRTWPYALTLDPVDHDVAYPDGKQAPDGSIYIIHDFARREGGFVFMHHVTEDDIVAGKLVTPTSWLHRLVGKSKPV
ncbi:MAG: exo-alpha-sialidase, partial [Victivallales bacterium]|nr:exo-alpha-sialidase [Victivallales bacterium]